CSRACRRRSVLCCTALALTVSFALSLHDALPILLSGNSILSREFRFVPLEYPSEEAAVSFVERHLVSPEYISDRKGKGVLLSQRSEEHTSELQSRFDLVCRLLLQKKNDSPYLYAG